MANVGGHQKKSIIRKRGVLFGLTCWPQTGELVLSAPGQGVLPPSRSQGLLPGAAGDPGWLFPGGGGRAPAFPPLPVTHKPGCHVRLLGQAV